MNILAIDPGPHMSAYVRFNDRTIFAHDKVDNAVIFDVIESPDWDTELVVIEKIAAMGMSVGAETFETVFWSGRFADRADRCGIECQRITRAEVKLHLCGNMRAKDPNVRQALIDFYGGNSVAIGGKKCRTCKGRKLVGLGKARGPCGGCDGSGWLYPPGPLLGVAADEWSALAIAVTWWETKRLETKGT